MNVVGNVLASPPENITRPFDAWRIGYDRLLEEIDPRVAATLLRHGNYNEATRQVEWDGKIKERTLPASLYLKAKPAFFGDHPWPAIGPDVEPHAGFLPAKDRYDREPRKPRSGRTLSVSRCSRGTGQESPRNGWSRVRPNLPRLQEHFAMIT